METVSDCPSSPDGSPDVIQQDLIQQAIKRRARDVSTPVSVQEKSSTDNNNDVGFVLGDMDDENEEQENDDVCRVFMFFISLLKWTFFIYTCSNT